MDFADFPERLREIPDAPRSLYVRGEMPHPDLVPLVVVGSRRMSAYGKRVCEDIVGSLTGYPIAIISGLAIGLDSVAHEAALSAGLHTVAVMPSGLDDSALYPARHKPLAHAILRAGGALISEYEPTEHPARWTFLARNRIMAGLARATLLIEAAERSGTLVTARLALDYNREVLVVPHSLGSETGAGCNALIRQGATLVRSGADVLEALGIRSKEAPLPLRLDLSEDEQEVYDALRENCERGELHSRCALPQQRINVALSMLLIKGAVREELGKIMRV